jgi:hypothetical protein
MINLVRPYSKPFCSIYVVNNVWPVERCGQMADGLSLVSTDFRDVINAVHREIGAAIRQPLVLETKS